MIAVQHLRPAYEGNNGWIDGRIGIAYDLIAEVLADLGQPTTNNSLLAAIEEADMDLAKGRAS
ncbi:MULTISPECIES: hypothetical protein [unclassified Novosphingobium]|uniref:hypothetical protein n=1 Tax=unclassified Novosphingobium TaxID=2644732 RepID=UPI00135A4223|nr:MULTISPECIES: hypothetical protein [unclassified Novosphingobium]